jgi:hypothetical protein
MNPQNLAYRTVILKQRDQTWAIAEKTNCESAAVYAPPYDVPLGRSPLILC